MSGSAQLPAAASLEADPAALDPTSVDEPAPCPDSGVSGFDFGVATIDDGY
jgi:hypothetical protein